LSANSSFKYSYTTFALLLSQHRKATAKNMQHNSSSPPAFLVRGRTKMNPSEY